MISRPSSLSYKWVILGLLTVTHVMNVYSGRGILPLAPFLQSEFHLKHVQIGMLTSSFFMGALFLSIPMGWLVDRIGIYWTMAMGQLILGSFIVSISFANSFLIICGLLFLAGMGHATINPSTGKAIMTWFSKKGRATAMGVKQTGIPMGGVLAAGTMPAFALTFGWRKALVISGAASLVSVLLCLLLYRESKMEESGNSLQPLHPSSLQEVFKNRDLMLLSCLIIVFLCLQMTVETYLLLFCRDRLLYSVITAGYFLSLGHFGGVVGRLTWGPISDFFFGGRRKIVLMMIGGFSTAICLAFVFLSPQFPIWAVVVLVFFFGFCAIGWNGMYLTWVAELAGKDRAGVATGISLSIGFLGVFFGPPFFGYIVDQTHSYSYAWLIFSLMIGLTTLFMGLVHEPTHPLSE